MTDSARHVRICLFLAGLAAILTGPASAAQEPPDAKQLALSLQAAFADAIERAEPSVVSVVRMRQEEDDTQSFLPRRERFGQILSGPRDPNWVPQDFGSGVIIDPDGLILTNHHVIDQPALTDPRSEDRVLVWVVLQDGRGLTAKVIAADPRSDLAVLKVPARNLKPITMGDVSKLRKGHFVLVLGNPHATARDGRASASWGIISNIARRLPPPTVTEEPMLHHNGTLLQTDARLNYGTSGGALINLNGEMIGLATSFAAIRGFDQAAGYAIPMDETVQRIIGVLREGREMEYGFLGITMSEASQGDSGGLRGSDTPIEGARVQDCHLGSPAHLAGMQAGDVITAVDGIPIRNREDLVMTVGTRFFAGEEVPFTVLRLGARKTLPVTLGKYPITGQVIPAKPSRSWRGLHVDYTTLLMKRRPDDPEAFPGADRKLFPERLRLAPEGGVLVVDVDSKTPAAAAKIEPSTVIFQVAGTPVRNPIEFYNLVGKLSGKVELVTEKGKFTIGE